MFLCGLQVVARGPCSYWCWTQPQPPKLHITAFCELHTKLPRALGTRASVSRARAVGVTGLALAVWVWTAREMSVYNYKARR